MRMVKDQRIGIGIFVYNIVQHDPVRQRQLFHILFAAVYLRVVFHVFVVDLLLQIVRHAHEKRLEIRDLRLIVVDPVRGGQKPHRRHAEGADLAYHARHVLSGQDHADQIQDQPRHAHRLDQKPRCRVENIVALHGVYIAFPAFAVFRNKIIFLVGDLDLLDAHDRFFDPFIKAAVIILVFDARLPHDRL